MITRHPSSAPDRRPEELEGAAGSAQPPGSSLGQLATLLWAKLRMGRHWVASVRTESKLKVAFVSVSAVFLLALLFLFALGMFYLFSRFGSEMLGEENDVDLTDLVLERLLSVFALSVFVLMVVSNVLVSFATIYRSKEVSYLIQAPLSVGTFFLGRFWECVSFSSWGLAFLGTPVLVAYGIVRGVSPLFYPALPLFYAPFVVIPAAIGAGITVALVRLLAGRPRAGLGVLLVLAGTFLWGLFRVRSRPDLEGAETVQAVLDLMGTTQSPFLPSHWLTQGLLAAAHAQPFESLFFWLTLLANALFFVTIATLLAERWFYPGWTALLAADEQRERPTARGPLRFLEAVFAWIPEPTRSLVAKDLRLFWRDPSQWSQFLIFFGLMALYLANIENDSGFFSEEPWRSWIALLNMAAALLILATLTTRFVFPLISLEGRRFWILGLAPLTKRRLLWQKFWLSVLTTSTITIGLALLSGWRLRLEPFELGLTLFSVAATTVALSGLAVGLGSLYPNFEEDNPARITSGMGGTLNFILSFAFIITVTVLQGVLLQWRRTAPPARLGVDTATLIVLSVIVTLSVTTCALAMRAGRRNLESAEL